MRVHISRARKKIDTSASSVPWDPMNAVEENEGDKEDNQHTRRAEWRLLTASRSFQEARIRAISAKRRHVQVPDGEVTAAMEKLSKAAEVGRLIALQPTLMTDAYLKMFTDLRRSSPNIEAACARYETWRQERWTRDAALLVLLAKRSADEGTPMQIYTCGSMGAIFLHPEFSVAEISLSDYAWDIVLPQLTSGDRKSLCLVSKACCRFMRLGVKKIHADISAYNHRPRPESLETMYQRHCQMTFLDVPNCREVVITSRTKEASCDFFLALSARLRDAEYKISVGIENYIRAYPIVSMPILLCCGNEEIALNKKMVLKPRAIAFQSYVHFFDAMAWMAGWLTLRPYQFQPQKYFFSERPPDLMFDFSVGLDDHLGYLDQHGMQLDKFHSLVSWWDNTPLFPDLSRPGVYVAPMLPRLFVPRSIVELKQAAKPLAKGKVYRNALALMFTQIGFLIGDPLGLSDEEIDALPVHPRDVTDLFYPPSAAAEPHVPSPYSPLYEVSDSESSLNESVESGDDSG